MASISRPNIIEVSVVIPCLNEADNAEAISNAVVNQLKSENVTYEIIFIDNGSVDGTVSIIKKLCRQDPNIRLIVNNKNYGQMRSPTHAIYQTIGKAVIGICADFQDPPEMIPEFIRRWRAGVPIILGVRETEDTTIFLRLIRLVGYHIYSRFGDYRVIPNATGFGLYDRRVVDCVKQWRDSEPFFRGMLVESGFPIETIKYKRPPRAAGRSKNSVFSLLEFGLAGLSSSTKKILLLPLYVSILFYALFILSLISVAMFVLIGQLYVALWALSIGLILFVSGLNFSFLGLLGDQVRLIAAMSRNTPLVVESERVNFPADRTENISFVAEP